MLIILSTQTQHQSLIRIDFLDLATYDEINDGSPAITVVDVISESRGVDDSELDLELLLLEFSLDDFCAILLSTQF